MSFIWGIQLSRIKFSIILSPKTQLIKYEAIVVEKNKKGSSPIFYKCQIFFRN